MILLLKDNIFVSTRTISIAFLHILGQQKSASRSCDIVEESKGIKGALESHH